MYVKKILTNLKIEKIKLMNEREFKKLYEIAKEETLKQASAMLVANKIVKVSGKRVDLQLEGRDIEIVYYPALDENGNEIKNAPLILGYHGGGFVFGGCALDDTVWTTTAKTLGVNIASVGYRMGPTYMWREALADAYDSVLYLKEHADEFGFDSNHISLMGSSAGATLVATVALKANQEKSIKFDNQILVYPFLDLYTDPESKGPGNFVGPICYIMNDLHVSHEESNLPLVSPVYATRDILEGLPNAIFAICENDNLKHEGFKYADMLKDADVKVSTLICEKMPHGFFEVGFKKPTKFDYDFLGEESRELIDDGTLSKWAYKTLDFIKENFTK